MRFYANRRERLDEKDREQDVKRDGRRRRRSVWIDELGQRDRERRPGELLGRRRDQKDRVSELRGTLLLPLLGRRAAAIRGRLGHVARVSGGMLVSFQLPGTVTRDAAVVASLRVRFPAGAGRHSRAKEREHHNGGGQTIGHLQLTVLHRTAKDRAIPAP